MTEQMAKRLNLSPQRTESLLVSTFGTKKTQSLETYVVNFNIITKEGKLMSVCANVLQQITGPIRRGPINQADVDFFKQLHRKGWLIVFLLNPAQQPLTFC